MTAQLKLIGCVPVDAQGRIWWSFAAEPDVQCPPGCTLMKLYCETAQPAPAQPQALPDDGKVHTTGYLQVIDGPAPTSLQWDDQAAQPQAESAPTQARAFAVWLTEGACECLQRGEGPVRGMPEANEETGFTVPFYAQAESADARDELRIMATRALIAWDGTVLPKSHDGLMFERMEDLRAALAAKRATS